MNNLDFNKDLRLSIEFTTEFSRRLIRLYKAIDFYLDNGKTCDLFPALFSVYSYLWTTINPYKRYGNKRNKK